MDPVNLHAVLKHLNKSEFNLNSKTSSNIRKYAGTYRWVTKEKLT